MDGSQAMESRASGANPLSPHTGTRTSAPTSSVVVHQGVIRPRQAGSPSVHCLPSILLQVRPGDPKALLGAVCELHLDKAASADRHVVLRDLCIEGGVGVKCE